MTIENPFDAMRSAVQQARDLNRAVDSQANTIADLLQGRLRTLTPGRLAALKRELRDFNMHTGVWREVA